jgi:uncharacterized protein
MYMYAAMADLAAELDDPSLKKTCEILWKDVIGKRMYVTGGLGPSASNEGFTQDYDLPNDTAYAETCASVALIFWAQRMLNFECDLCRHTRTRSLQWRTRRPVTGWHALLL